MGTQLFHFRHLFTTLQTPTWHQTEGSILSTTEYQDNSNQENQINDINYDDSYNPIMIAFNDS